MRVTSLVAAVAPRAGKIVFERENLLQIGILHSGFTFSHSSEIALES